MKGRLKSKPHIYKKIVITTVILVCIALALLILFHQNPMDDPGTTRLKKFSGISLVGVACVLFCVFFDQLKAIPLELYSLDTLSGLYAIGIPRQSYCGALLELLLGELDLSFTVDQYAELSLLTYDAAAVLVARLSVPVTAIL